MIKGWINPNTGRKCSFEETSDIAKVMPIGLLQLMQWRERTDVRHSGPNITITSALGCPRQLYIRRMIDVEIDPTKMWAAQRGTLLHEQMGHAMATVTDSQDEPLFWTEEHDETKCVFDGELFGVKTSCKIDCYRRDLTELWDFKFRNPYATNYLKRDMDGGLIAKEEDAAQLNMMRLLMEQNLGKSLKDMELVVWVESGGWHRTIAPYMTEGQVGSLRPYGSSLTVREMFGMLNVAMRDWESGGDPLRIIKNTPMVGMDMFKGRGGRCKCSHYCEVKEACYDIEGGI